MKKRFGEYARRGDYHIELPLDWPYLPVYLEKMALVRRFLDTCRPDQVIYDMGCGEGVLVNEYRQAGFQIIGMDLNYSSEFIVQRDFLNSGIPDNSTDVIICTDVLEHLIFVDQARAISEFARILRPGGRALISVPNLAHFASRVSFFFTGKLVRTSSIERHPGDRPVHEYIRMFQKYFQIARRRGVFPTFPIISVFTLIMPSNVIWLHKIYNRLLGYPNWCFLNIFYLIKTPV
ncbi:MAG TPA: methyltransferase domain-containing protein [Anaerolineales bacterium]|jgi:predicted SAM-dependent methyltransferase|nr:methyltransferase domain-containing protein [Anaerolineales bacterium]